MRLKLAVVAVLLLSLQSLAFTPRNLVGATVVQRGQCALEGYTFMCLGVEKDGEKFLVFLDAKGAFAIFKVTDFKKVYEEEDAELVWQRPISRTLEDEA